MTLTTFDDLGLSKNIVATLTTLGFSTPTPIQEKVSPSVLAGRDLMPRSDRHRQDGRFWPADDRDASQGRERPDNRTTRALILAPTRELVNQIGDNLRSYLRRLPLKINQSSWRLDRQAAAAARKGHRHPRPRPRAVCST